MDEYCHGPVFTQINVKQTVHGPMLLWIAMDQDEHGPTLTCTNIISLVFFFPQTLLLQTFVEAMLSVKKDTLILSQGPTAPKKKKKKKKRMKENFLWAEVEFEF